MKVLFVFVALAAFMLAQPADANVYGVDVSQPYTSSHFQCLKGQNLSVGRPDPNCANTVAAAWAGGFKHVDVYMFPCPRCGNPVGQVTEAVNYLRQHNVKYGQFWLDVEGTQYWMAQGDNRNFFTSMKNQAKAMGINVAVYSSAVQWNGIMGNWNGGADLPLWYAHYDNSASFSDFKAFGGWTRPNMKQFSDKGSKCGVNYDINWYPN